MFARRPHDYFERSDMIGVFVTFRFGDNFDERAVRKIAETVRATFEGMPGLRSKAFTLNSEEREATNFYVWDSEEAAKAFFTEERLKRVAGLYGVRPSVEFVQIAALVENILSRSRDDARLTDAPDRYSERRPRSRAADL
jgi:heme-degrading monooxygenase HmoA